MILSCVQYAFSIYIWYLIYLRRYAVMISAFDIWFGVGALDMDGMGWNGIPLLSCTVAFDSILNICTLIWT